MSAPIDFKQVLQLLKDSGARFITIGGVAAGCYGSTIPTHDVDICYARDDMSFAALSKLLMKLHAYPRGAPKGLPFKLDVRTLKAGLNFTFDTDLGPIDILGELEGLGDYDAVLKNSITAEIFGVAVPVISLPELIQAKTIANRPKDLAVVEELKLILAANQRAKGV